jgi:hypothetical protein
MKLVALTTFQVNDLLACLEESYNQTTGEDDLGLSDFHETVNALKAAVTITVPKSGSTIPQLGD